MHRISSLKVLRLYAILMSAIIGLSAYTLIAHKQYDILFAFYTLPVITFIFFAFHFTGLGMKLAAIHAREEMCLSETRAEEFLAPRVLRLFAAYFCASALLVALIVGFVGAYEYFTMDTSPLPSSFFYYDPIYARTFTFSTSLLVHYALAFVAGWVMLLAACLILFRGLCRKANLDRPQNILPYFQASFAALAAYCVPWIAGIISIRFMSGQVDSDMLLIIASVVNQIGILACCYLAARVWSRTCREYYLFEEV